MVFETCKEAIHFIESKRIKRSFADFQKIIDTYAIPTKLPCTIHIAGTNGKGSTVQYLKNILVNHGYSVGTFTSPYMICHNDRICINGIPISEEKLLYYINDVLPMIEKENITMFEIAVVIMLRYFYEQAPDFCIIEVGIGGKEDKTNVIISDYSVVTNIGYDHQYMLGNSLTEIAKHKAGIIKENQQFFTGENNHQLLQIFKDICQQKQTVMEVVETQEGYQFCYQGNIYTLENNAASYYVYNAHLAVVVAGACIPLKFDLTNQAIHQFNYPGRFEKIGHIYLEGAHNEDGIRALVKTIEMHKFKSFCILFSALSDKDKDTMLSHLHNYSVFCVSFSDDRNASKESSYREVITEVYQKYETIIVTGSLHFISEVRKYILDNKTKF